MILFRLYYEFFKIGLFSVGGGLATLPFLHELMNKTGWFTMTDLSNLIAISECTPSNFKKTIRKSSSNGFNFKPKKRGFNEKSRRSCCRPTC